MDLERADVDSAQSVYGYSGEGIGSLFQPDALVKDQYLESFRRGASLEPEKELMLAILEDAIKTLQDNRTASGGQKKRLFEETEEWFFSDDADWVFSFVSVCGALGLDPDYLRKGISRWCHFSHNVSLN
jgi:hypothetical protein